MDIKYPTTPDGRYFVVKGTVWRCTNPNLSAEIKTKLVSELMSARREVKTALAQGDKSLLTLARSKVHQAKVKLGERGPTWWEDDKDYNKSKVKNTPYADWYLGLEKSKK